nr:cytochrome-c peroxidase [Chitinophaga pinensis]
MSCGFCHLQTAAFTHHGHDVSHGIDDRLGSRNSPPIMNLAWNTLLCGMAVYLIWICNR